MGVSFLFVKACYKKMIWIYWDFARIGLVPENSFLRKILVVSGTKFTLKTALKEIDEKVSS